MDAILFEWGSLLLRWLHIVAGMAWIGSSFYFMHIDASIKPAPDIPAGKGGESWEVHGGGFYHVRKWLVAPERLPPELIWHKWEAYTTWVSGFALLAWMYYFAADLYLIDPAIRQLSPWAAAGIGIGGLVLGWVVYDLLCKSPLAKNELALGAIGFAMIMFMAWFYQQMFSGRGALVHTGALMATLMSGNVAMNIIPNQRKVIADLVAGRVPNPDFGKQAKTRSTHNNYLTLPVVFLMITNHYPLVSQSPYAWVMVGFVLVGGAAIRHFYNERHAGRGDPWWTWALAAATMVAVIVLGMVSVPAGRDRLGLSPLPLTRIAVSNVKIPAAVDDIILTRCSMCHAAEPAWAGVAAAPKGLMLDTPERIVRNAHAIKLHAVTTHDMPPNNMTQMTPAERHTLAMWLAGK